MKWMKTAGLVVLLMLIMTGAASAKSLYEKQTEVSAHVEVIKVPTMTEETVMFALYDEDREEELAVADAEIGADTDCFDLTFAVPAYDIGERFYLVMEFGGESLTFNGATARDALLQTYVYTDSEGDVAYQTRFYMSMAPSWERVTELLLGGIAQKDNVCFIDDVPYGNAAFLEDLRLSVGQAESGYLLSAPKTTHTMMLFGEDIYACRDWEPYNMDVPTVMIDGTLWFPLPDIARHFDCHYEETDDGYKKTVSMIPSAYGMTPEEVFINSTNVSSRKNYLIWVSKKDFKVNVFTGSQHNWVLVKSFPCTIGTNETPTIEGEFEYIERLNRWTYDDFYCGPVMRFYNGYAIHSTLIGYNGKMYDDRVGVKASHGCVRVHVPDIEWLVENIPFYTRIYVTK